MKATRREFVALAAAWASLPAWAQTAAASAPSGRWPWENDKGRATPHVMVRRLHLDIAGRLPRVDEARAYVQSKDKDRRARLVDALLASEDFADYWSMRLCDLLRVKSEFPINLWPNAVYVYHRRIREAVLRDEPLDAFAASLVTASGSDFRDAEANFTRATNDRSPEGIARTAVRTFFDEDLAAWPEDRRAAAVAAFEGVQVKTTREWKEEIVCCSGVDRRAEFAALVTGSMRGRFAAAFAGYVAYWMFGRRGADAALGERFLKGGCRLKPLVRAIVLSDEYAAGAVTGGFPLRRLDAEVLDDALCSLTGSKRSFSSIAPEPFTFLPPERKSVLIEDGSISSAFLTLFGRPPRDSGLPEERGSVITAKQRHYLFNSGSLYQRLGRIKGKYQDLYWKFLSRPPTADERAVLDAAKPSLRDLAWCLLNSREFLYRS